MTSNILPLTATQILPEHCSLSPSQTFSSDKVMSWNNRGYAFEKHIIMRISSLYGSKFLHFIMIVWDPLSVLSHNSTRQLIFYHDNPIPEIIDVEIRIEWFWPLFPKILLARIFVRIKSHENKMQWYIFYLIAKFNSISIFNASVVNIWHNKHIVITQYLLENDLNFCDKFLK